MLRAAGQLRLEQAQGAVAAQGRHRVVAGQAANADRLSFIVEAELSLTCQHNMFEGLAVHRMRGDDASAEPAHRDVPHEQGAIHVAVAEIEAR